MGIEVLQFRLASYHRSTGASHWASSKSVLPILVDIKAKMQPGDVCILSKAHAISAYHLVFNGELPDKPLVQGEFGSLGMGLPFAVGVAFMRQGNTVYVVVGDGETQEGSFWEALSLSERLRLPNLQVYVDCNGMQGMGPCWTQSQLWRTSADYVHLVKTDKGPTWECHYRGPE